MLVVGPYGICGDVIRWLWWCHTVVVVVPTVVVLMLYGGCGGAIR